ncbi:hypothetical protein GCM10010149_56370 [Nonomuraea roseoviolacea subsp. roseoviolacea]|uniref:hypothetical protein n=1 Tax=Nonomuraea roseoviolacea TaxID=103837 RepID=UPI0031DB5343
MSGLLWDDVKPFFDTRYNGVLPDVVVEGTSTKDWQILLDLVQSRNWKGEYQRDGVPSALPTAAELVAEGAGSADLNVWPVPEVRAIFRPYSAESIDFDLDLRELQGQERLDVLLEFLTVIGRRLGKSVLMSPEGDYGHPVLGYVVETDQVALLADPADPADPASPV